MRYESVLRAAVFVFVFGPATVRPEVLQTTVGEIKKSLVCLCECNMTVEACQGSMACQSAEKLTAEAQRYIDQGLAKDAVLATFVKTYGEHILAAPSKSGFNLMAWILPFAGILLAGFGITTVLRKWARRPQIPTGTNGIKKASVDSKNSPYEERLDEMLHFLD